MLGLGLCALSAAPFGAVTGPHSHIGARCQAKLNSVCAADTLCVDTLHTEALTATKVGPGVWRCVAESGRFCTRNTLALEHALRCRSSAATAEDTRPAAAADLIDNGGKPYVIVNLLGQEEWKNVHSSSTLPGWLREPRSFCSPAARRNLPSSQALCGDILDNATASRCAGKHAARGTTTGREACGPFKVFLPANAGTTPVTFTPGLKRWMDSHAQLGPADTFIQFFRSRVRPSGGGAFLDNGCSLDGRQLQYILSKLPGAFGVGLQVERDFPFVMEQRCERCALVKMRPEGEALPFRNGAFDGVLSVNVLEHALNAAQYVRESVRVLRTGGFFYATWCPTFGAHNGHHLNQVGTSWRFPSLKPSTA